MRIDFLNDAFEFRWTRLRASDGALCVGYPEPKTAEELQRFVRIFQFDQPGNSVKDLVKNSAYVLSGNYEWEEDPTGTNYLVLRGGLLEVMPAADSPLTELVVVVSLWVRSYPSTKTTFLECGGINFSLTPEGYVEVALFNRPPANSKMKIPKGWVSLTFVYQTKQGFWAAQMYFNAERAWEAEGEGSWQVFRENHLRVRGDLCLRALYVAKSLDVLKEANQPGLTGEWESRIFSFEKPMQLVLISAEPRMSESDVIEVEVTAADEPSCTLGRTAKVRLEPNRTVYLVDPVWGRYLKVIVRFASLGSLAALRSLNLELMDFPFLSVSLSHTAPKPGSTVEVRLAPERLSAEVPVFLGQAPSYVVRAAPDGEVRASGVWLGPLHAGFKGAPKVSLPAGGYLEITGEVLVPQEGVWTFALDGEGSGELWVGGQRVLSFLGRSPGETPQPRTGQVQLEAGWHPFRLLLGPVGTSPKLYAAMGLASLEVLGPGSLRGATKAQAKGGVAGALSQALLWEDAELVVGSFRYRLDLAEGAEHLGYGLARSFQSPHALSPKLRFLERFPFLPSRYAPLSDGVRLFLFDRRGLVLAWREGGKVEWVAYTGPITGQPCLKDDKLYVPSLLGLWVLHRLSGKGRRIVREGSFPMAVLPEHHRLLISWSDHALTSHSPEGGLRSVVRLGTDPAHLDVPHADAPYLRILHQDVPHADVPHTDTWHDIHENEGRFVPPYYPHLRYEEQSYWKGVYARSENPHGDTAHADVAHGDTPHGDGPPHLDYVLGPNDAPKYPLGVGTTPWERGLNHEILCVRPSGVFLLSEGLDVLLQVLPEQGAIRFACLNDEHMGYPWTRAILVAEGSCVRALGVSGARYFLRDLGEEVAWAVPSLGGYLVGAGSTVHLLSPLDGSTIASARLEGRITGFPTVLNKGFLLTTTAGTYFLSETMDILDFVSTGKPALFAVVWKEQTVAVVTEDGLYLFVGGEERSPALRVVQPPWKAREGEDYWLWADADSPASVLWDTGLGVRQGAVVHLVPPFPGELLVYASAGKNLARAVVEVLPRSKVPMRRAHICATSWRESIIQTKEGTLLTAFGLNDIYTDQRVRVYLDLLGESLEGRVARFVLKKEEGGQALLAKNFTALHAGEGLAALDLLPSDLSSLQPGRYLWAVILREANNEEHTVARGWLELHPGVA